MPEASVMVPSVTGGVALLFTSFTLPVGVGVVCCVPVTVAVNATLCPVTVVDGAISSVVAVGCSTGEILPKRPRVKSPTAVVL